MRNFFFLLKCSVSSVTNYEQLRNYEKKCFTKTQRLTEKMSVRRHENRSLCYGRYLNIFSFSYVLATVRYPSNGSLPYQWFVT